MFIKRYFKTGEELWLEPTYFCTRCFQGNIHKSKYQLYPVVPSYYALAPYALLSALQSVSLLSSVILAYLPITVAAEDNVAPLAWEKWPMCHHLILGATAIATIITAIIVTAKIQKRKKKKKRQQHFPKQSSKILICFCTLAATYWSGICCNFCSNIQQVLHLQGLDTHTSLRQNPQPIIVRLTTVAMMCAVPAVSSYWGKIRESMSRKERRMSLLLAVSVLAVCFIGKPCCEWRMPLWWQESTQMKCPWERHWIPTSVRQQESVPRLPFGTRGVKEDFFYQMLLCK